MYDRRFYFVFIYLYTFFFYEEVGYVTSPNLFCAGCKYTCHAHCRDHVALDCHQNGSSIDVPLNPISQDHLNNNQASQSVSSLSVCVIRGTFKSFHTLKKLHHMFYIVIFLCNAIFPASYQLFNGISKKCFWLSAQPLTHHCLYIVIT